MVDLDVRYLGGGRQQVVHERTGQELAVVGVCGMFVQHAADALGDTTPHLPFDDGRVDHRPTVLDNQVAVDLDLTRVGVDRYPHRMRGLRPAALVPVEVVVD